MPEAGVDARQWILTRLKHAQVDRGLLVSRRVSYFVRVTSGEFVDGRLGRVHGHVKLPPMHPVSHHRAHPHFAITRDELHPSAALNPTFFGKFWRDFDKRVRRFLANSVTAVSQIAFMEVFQKPAIVQMQIKFLIRLVGGLGVGEREQPGFAVRKIEVFPIEQRLIGPVSCYWPLE